MVNGDRMKEQNNFPTNSFAKLRSFLAPNLITMLFPHLLAKPLLQF